MGDRGNIKIKNGDNAAVWLYGHWSGHKMCDVLRAALRRRERWNDEQYLTRIIYDQLVGDDRGTTGFGISARMGDNGHPILVVDPDTQTVAVEDEEGVVVVAPMPMSDFIERADDIRHLGG